MAINRLTIRLARSSLCQRGCTILHVVENFAVTQAYPFIRLGIILKLTFLLVVNILVTPQCSRNSVTACDTQVSIVIVIVTDVIETIVLIV